MLAHWFALFLFWCLQIKHKKKQLKKENKPQEIPEDDPEKVGCTILLQWQSIFSQQ
jgi:hypothetical protein